MQKYQDIITRNTGSGLQPVRSASIQVNTHGGSAATIYSDNSGNAAANPLTADSSGHFSFYAADGRYDLAISGANIAAYTLSDIQLFDAAASTGAAGVSFIQSGTGALTSTVQAALRLFVHTSQFDTTGHFTTARDALGGTIGLPAVEVAGKLRAISTIRFTTDDTATSTDLEIDKVIGGTGGVQGAVQIKAVGTQTNSAAILQLVPSDNAVAVSASINSELLLFNVPGANYERFAMAWFGGALVIDTTALGTGTARPIVFNIGTTRTMLLNASGLVGIGPNAANSTVADNLHIMRSSTTEAAALRIENGQASGYGNGITFHSTDADGVTVLEAATIYVSGAASWNGAANRSSDMVFRTRSANTLAARVRILAGGILSIGEPVTSGGAAGDVVVLNTGALRAANNAGSGTTRMIESNTSDQVVLGGGGADVKFGRALIALGAGAAPTVGTIGGSGPATAGQNSWKKEIDSTGAAYYIPIWK